MNKINKKTLAIVGVALLAGLGIGAAINAPYASANAFSDFLNNLAAPFSPHSSTTSTTASSQNQSVSLYQPTVDYENAVVAAVKKASPAVVSITISENVPIEQNCPFTNLPPDFQQFFGNDFPNLQQQCSGSSSGQTQLQQVGGGSGFIISSDGLILTNKHVVSETNASYSVLTNDGKTYTAKVLARSPNQDIAVLKINTTGLPTVTLGDSSGIQLGQTAIAIGNALGQFSNTVSVGVISGLARTVTAAAPTGGQETIQGVVQTDAAINPGNSGGPLLNLQGEVIGINTAIASQAENIGFALPINTAKSAITSVEATGQIQVPYLGVRYIPITPDLATQDKLPVTQGALVQGTSGTPAVATGSPAAKAGLQNGDIITAVSGQPIDVNHDLGDVINSHSIGDVISLTVNRGGKSLTIQATLAKRAQ